MFFSTFTSSDFRRTKRAPVLLTAQVNSREFSFMGGKKMKKVKNAITFRLRLFVFNQMNFNVVENRNAL